VAVAAAQDGGVKFHLEIVKNQELQVEFSNQFVWAPIAQGNDTTLYRGESECAAVVFESCGVG